MGSDRHDKSVITFHLPVALRILWWACGVRSVCAMVCVWAWETDCRSKMHSITVWKQPWGVAGQAEGGWEVTCFRRLSLNMRAQILTFMSGSTHQCPRRASILYLALISNLHEEKAGKKEHIQKYIMLLNKVWRKKALIPTMQHLLFTCPCYPSCISIILSWC